MLIRTTDPIRSNVYKMLVGDAKKIAKEAQREATQEDLVVTARRQVKETETAIELIRKGGGDCSKYEAELAILRTFLPAALDEAAVKAAVEQAIQALPAEERTKKSMSKVMAAIKDIPGMDMKLASRLVAPLLP